MFIALPLITGAADYESFRKIMGGNLAYTYDEWLNLLPQWRDQHATDGNQTRDVHVDPDQFDRFLDATGRAPDLNALSLFAQSIYNGEAY